MSIDQTYNQLPISEYDSLYIKIQEDRLMERTVWRYALLTILNLVGVGIGTYIITVTDSLLFLVADALFLTLFMGQLGVLAHDLSHGQVFASERLNRRCAMIVWCLICGLSESHWFNGHRAHHKHPNHIGYDPTINIPFAFDTKQLESRSAFYKKWFVPGQHIYYVFNYFLVYPAYVLVGVHYIFNKPSKRKFVELSLMVIHFLAFFWFCFTFLPLYIALIFLIVLHSLVGAYMGLLFAPNHKGCPMLRENEAFNWAYQITFSRNIHHTPFMTYFLAGLDHQIEHHLFPSMSRYNIPKTQKHVTAFCTEHHIPYYETSLKTSLDEIYSSLRTVAYEYRK